MNVLAIHRGELVAVSVIGIVLGAIALFLPDVTLLTVAILFGSYLVVSGIFRVSVAAFSRDSGAAVRWLGGVLGVLLVAAGVYCLVSPERSLSVLAFVIGFGFVAEGIIDIMAGIQGIVSPTWLAVVSGVVSIIAGIVTFTLPGLALSAFLVVGAVLLIAVSVSTLLTLPRRNTVASM